MFIENKYLIIYNKIIEIAKSRCIDGYLEKHHIVPKSLGGSDDLDNIVELTAREHFICHRILTKITTGQDRYKMLHAVGRFVQDGRNTSRMLSSRQYEIARRSISEARTGTKHSDESRRKMSDMAKGRTPWNKGLKGVQSVSEEHKQILRELYTGTTKSDKTRQRISESKKGHTAGMTGKQHSDETRLKMSESAKGKKGPQKRHFCPYCQEHDKTARHIKFCKTKVDYK